MPAKINPPMRQKMPVKLRLKIANECDNILDRVKLNPSNKKYRYYLLHSKQLDETTTERLMALFELLMKDMYEKSSWGWDEQEKLSEWKHSRTRIIIITKDDMDSPLDILSSGKLPGIDEELVGFMCFRFEVGADKSECAQYVYELHIARDFQRQGLGEELMRMAKMMALEFKMDKIMLTVFRSNQQALQFYKKLKYTPDRSSPATNEADYMILSVNLRN